MLTIRKHVFETNSSSEHCVTVSKELRTADDFPQLTEDGVLEIEAKINWECGQPGTVTDDVRDIIDYLCMMAYHCVPWDASADGQKYVRTKSFKLLLSIIQDAYTNVGLEPPKEIRYYFTDVHDKKYVYDAVPGDIIWPSDDEGIHEVIIDKQWTRMSEEELNEFKEKEPEKFASCIIARYMFGLNHNLAYDDYSSLSFEEDYCGDDSYGISDLLEYKFTLDFYRT